VMNLVFVLILLAALIATGRVAYSFRMPQSLRALPQRLAEVIRTTSVQPAFAGRRPPETAVPEERSRAFAIADAVAASQRRETFAPPPPPTQLGPGPIGETITREVIHGAATPNIPLGQSTRRRTRGRVSATATRRDSSR
jgi:type IV secretion system protein VirB6